MTIAARAIAAMRPQERLIPAGYPLGRAWHAFRTNIKCEYRAKIGIEILGFETFVPLEQKYIRRRGFRVKVQNPLFSRYGFVKFDVEKDDWGPIKEVDGVEDILRNNQLPVRVPAQEIEKLKLAQTYGLFDRTKAPLPFKPGTDVEIGEGPYAGFIGKVVKARSADRIKILLSMFGANREIDIPLLHIRANQI